MLDIQLIRDAPDETDRLLGTRGHPPAARELLRLDQARRDAVVMAQDLQTERNAVAKQIGAAKGAGDTAGGEKLQADAQALKDKLHAAEEAQRAAQAALDAALAVLPNLPLADVPIGEDEAANVELRKHGTPTRRNAARPHDELGEALGLMDFAGAAELSGARFVILRGALAQLERALGQFMLDLHTRDNGYTEIAPPALVRAQAMFGTGQLPKFAGDSFQTDSDHWLIPTAEVPLTNLVREQIIAAEALPMRFTALTPCFRSEAGAAGRDTRGMIRLHQFSKVELVSIVAADAGEAELERMTQCAEGVLQKLDLPYRVVTLSTGDMGFAARKTYDLEVWLPGQGAYREISSCSYCGDFQARRMQARTRSKGDKRTQFLHTLNGSGLAIGRTLVAVLENYAQDDGSIAIPDALQPYMGGLTRIEKDEKA